MNGSALIIMYHSVASGDIPAVPGAFAFPFERFKYQIEAAISAGYTPRRISELREHNDGKNLYITSDDGTRDWTRNALPWCEEREIPTHTGVITGPWEQPPFFPLTHTIQNMLVSRNRDVLETLSNTIANQYLNNDQLNYINTAYYYEEHAYRRLIKGAFNLVFDHDHALEILGELPDEERDALNDHFESPDYYKQFEFAEIGVHTRSHWALDCNTVSYYVNEIERSRQSILSHGLEPTDYYVSPMQPRYGAHVNDLAPLLINDGYRGALTAIQGSWNGDDFIIPRIDAIHVEKHLSITPFHGTKPSVAVSHP